MNEKFFDLKKEKQDRMINAAIKVFAINGYKHCSTDDIVKEAGISKGLLFHYFGSKLRLYEFLYDYCVRFLSLELKNSVSDSETDYFKIIEAQEEAKRNVLKTYPYLQLFIDRSMSEDDEDAVDMTSDLRDELQSIYDGFLNQADPAKFKKEADPAIINSLLQSTLSYLMREQLYVGGFSADRFFSDAMRYIITLKNICY